MPLLENLIQGFAGAAGDQNTVNRIEKKKAHAQQLSDYELQSKADTIIGDVKGIQQKLSQLPQGDPARTQLEQSLHQHQQAFTDLFHPTKNPDAFKKIGDYLKKHITGKAPAPAPQSNAVTPDRMASLTAGAAGVAPQNPLTPEEQKRAARINAGLEPKAVADRPESENWIPADVTFADGTKATLQRNSKDGRWTDLAGNPVPPERLATASVAPKTPPKDKYAWTKKNGKFVSVKLDANGQIIPGSENDQIVPPASLTGRISTGNYHFVDEKGQIHQVQETRTSMPAGQGATPSVPKTPGEAKSRVPKPEAASKDKIIGFKGNKDYQDTKASYEGAIDRTKTMDENLKNALNGDQQAMLSLVANHIGMTLGAQKGARITRAVWDEAVESTPWFQRIAAKFDDRGYLSGVTLAPDQMQQMVRLAHEKVRVLKEHMERLDAEKNQAQQSGTDDIDAIVKALNKK